MPRIMTNDFGFGVKIVAADGLGFSHRSAKRLRERVEQTGGAAAEIGAGYG